MKIRTRYMKSERSRIKLKPSGNSLTKQNFKDGANINNILKRYKNAGLNPFYVDPTKAQFGDFTEANDLYSKMCASSAIVSWAHETFNGLSADLRRKFRNDPAEMIKYIDDERNHDEAIKLGLLSKVAPIEPAEASGPEAAPEAGKGFKGGALSKGPKAKPKEPVVSSDDDNS